MQSHPLGFQCLFFKKLFQTFLWSGLVKISFIHLLIAAFILLSYLENCHHFRKRLHRI